MSTEKDIKPEQQSGKLACSWLFRRDVCRHGLRISHDTTPQHKHTHTHTLMTGSPLLLRLPLLSAIIIITDWANTNRILVWHYRADSSPEALLLHHIGNVSHSYELFGLELRFSHSDAALATQWIYWTSDFSESFLPSLLETTSVAVMIKHTGVYLLLVLATTRCFNSSYQWLILVSAFFIPPLPLFRQSHLWCGTNRLKKALRPPAQRPGKQASCKSLYMAINKHVTISMRTRSRDSSSQRVVVVKQIEGLSHPLQCKREQRSCQKPGVNRGTQQVATIYVLQSANWRWFLVALLLLLIGCRAITYRPQNWLIQSPKLS